ncbi:GMC oxidoreductase [Auriscalpium vulgare]|uniref:GMC oxidoreductase n=1 Tax=Auriscalpium vulgare TaxID=40419 RepID=A0ACB8RZX6_9AGAM|nr:GMC oxidoreductase [Auriscalpium vulgare]
MLVRYFAFLSFRIFQGVLAALYSNPAGLVKHEYDFVIVGAGTAGNVIANRLSADSNVSVLLVEAGGNDAGLPALQIPFTASTVLSNASLIWNYTTSPQKALNGRVIAYQRGRVLGGSSSINFMFYTRGSRDDFDRFADVTGDSGWSWGSIFPYMLKIENFTTPVDHHNTSGQFNPSIHGDRGPLRPTLPGFPSSLDQRVLATTKVDPERFPFNLDVNSGNTIGMTWVQSTTGNGVRSSSATGYLHPILGRPNLDVLIDTQATRVLQTGSRGSIPIVRGVELANGVSGPRVTVHAHHEVILCAGAVNTPQLMLLSGIGNKHDLASLGISTVIHSPGVGQNLQDHPLLASAWSVNSNDTLDGISRNATLAGEILEQWETSKTGPFVDTGGNLFAWLRLPSIFSGKRDPSAGPTSAHVEIIPANEFISFSGDPTPANGSYVSIITGVISPASRGSVTLRSANPFDTPVIDPGFFTNELDVAAMVGAIRTSSALLETGPWKDLAARPFGLLENATTDAELAEYARNSASSFWHPTGTVKMGTSSDEMAVLDSKLRVKGAEGLRVVDASVFPFIPASHPQAPIYAIAERAADIIRSQLYERVGE